VHSLRRLLEGLNIDDTHPAHRILPPQEISRLYFDHALARAFLGEYQLAALSFLEAVKKDEFFALGWFAYGLAAAELGEWRNARKLFKSCIRTFERKGKGVDVLWYKTFQGRENLFLRLGEGWVLERTRVAWNFNKTYYEKGSKRLGINPRGAGQVKQIRAGLNGIPAGVYLGPGWDADASFVGIKELEPFRGIHRYPVSPASSRTTRHSQSLPILPSIRETPVPSWFEGDETLEFVKSNALRSTSMDDGHSLESNIINPLRLSSIYGDDEPDSPMHDPLRPSWMEGEDSPESEKFKARRLSRVGSDYYPDSEMDDTFPTSWIKRDNSLSSATHDALRPSSIKSDDSPRTAIHDTPLLPSVVWAHEISSPDSVTTCIPIAPPPNIDRTPTLRERRRNRHRSARIDSRTSIISQDFATNEGPRLSWADEFYSPYPVRSALPSPLRPQAVRTSISIPENISSTPEDFLIPLMAPRKGATNPLWEHFLALPRLSKAEGYGNFGDFDRGVALWKLGQLGGDEEEEEEKEKEEEDLLGKCVRNSWVADGKRVEQHHIVGDLERMEYIPNLGDEEERSVDVEDKTLVRDGEKEIPLLQPTLYEGWPHGYRKDTK
jgi:hypothetical protein